VYGALNPVTGQRLGDSYLDAFGLRSQKVWQWMALVYLWGFYFVLSSISAVLLKLSTPTNPMGTKRPAGARVNAKQLMEAVHNASDDTLAIASPAGDREAGVVIDVGPSNVKRLGGAKSSAGAGKESFQLSAGMPFTPATLSWKELKYTVYIGKEKTPRVLLNNISGYAEPGKLTALMGSSGAGKTTLLMSLLEERP